MSTIIELTGALIKEPHYTVSNSGNHGLVLTLLSSSPAREDRDNNPPIWWNISIWGNGLKAAGMLKKGAVIKATLRAPRIYQNKDGNFNINALVATVNVIYIPQAKPPLSHESTVEPEITPPPLSEG